MKSMVPSPKLIALVFMACTAAAGAADLYVGGATISITPDQPVALSGQMHTRIATEVATPVTANVLALESRDGDTVLEQAILVSCDLVGIREGIPEMVRARLADRLPGFDVNKLVLNATHTHTAPVMRQDAYKLPSEGIMQPVDYVEFLADQVADAAVTAWDARQPGTAGWGLGHALVAQNRRSIFEDGSAVMYGSTVQSAFRGMEGYEDHALEVLFFWNRDGRLVATAINLACPAQEVEGDSKIDADFWHPVRESLRNTYGKDLTVLAWTGAAGDQSPHLMYSKASEERMRELRGLSRVDEIARRIIAGWEEARAGAEKEKHSNLDFVHRVKMIELPRRIVTVAENEEAKATVAGMVADPNKHRLMQWHQAVVDRYARQLDGPLPPYIMELHVLRLGDVAIATNDFELFSDFGIQMKARSRALQTFVIQLAGPGTYVPTARAAAGGGYSAVAPSNEVGADGGQVLVEETLAVLDELFPE